MTASKEDITDLIKAIQSLEKAIKKAPITNSDSKSSVSDLEKKRAANKRRDTSLGLLSDIPSYGVTAIKVNCLYN